MDGEDVAGLGESELAFVLADFDDFEAIGMKFDGGLAGRCRNADDDHLAGDLARFGLDVEDELVRNRFELVI